MERDLFTQIKAAFSRHKAGLVVCPSDEKLCVHCKPGKLKCEKEAIRLANERIQNEPIVFAKMVARVVRILGLNGDEFRWMIDEAADKHPQ